MFSWDYIGLASWIGQVVGGSIVTQAIAQLFGGSASPVYLQRVFLAVPSPITLHKDIAVSFAGKSIPRLTRIHIYFWNNGREVLEVSDVASGDPLRIVLNEAATFLDASILRRSNPADGAELRIDADDSSTLWLDFEYWNPGDGVVIDLIHTGSESALTMIGSIKGSKKGVRSLGTAPWEARADSELSVIPHLLRKPWLMATVTAVFLAVSSWALLVAYWPSAALPSWLAFVIGLSAVSPLVICQRYSLRAPGNLFQYESDSSAVSEQTAAVHLTNHMQYRHQRRSKS